MLSGFHVKMWYLFLVYQGIGLSATVWVLRKKRWVLCLDFILLAVNTITYQLFGWVLIVSAFTWHKYLLFFFKKKRRNVKKEEEGFSSRAFFLSYLSLIHLLLSCLQPLVECHNGIFVIIMHMKIHLQIGNLLIYSWL